MAFKTSKEVFPGVIAPYGRITKTGRFQGNINSNIVTFGFDWFMSRDLAESNPTEPVYSIVFDIPFEPLMALIVKNPTDITGCIYAILNSLDPEIEGNQAYSGTQFFGLEPILEDKQTVIS